MARARAGLTEPPAAFSEPFVVIDDFLPAEHAAALRRGLEAHFADDRAAAREVWRLDVEADGARLGASPSKVLPESDVAGFVEALTAWSVETLGLAQVTPPWLVAHIGGCGDGPRTAEARGRFGYAYSLTADSRETVGGSLRLHRPPTPGEPLIDAVAPAFNRLVVFDTRLPHDVAPVAGSMDPRQGRLTLQGYISEGPPMAGGALPGDRLASAAHDAFLAFMESAFVEEFRGPATFHIEVGTDGAVSRCRVVLDRVLGPPEAARRWPRLLADLVARFEAMRLPPAPEPSEMLIPISFGAPISPSSEA